ncbi:hypothetical protein ACHAWF_018394 [Thalassiosira exigua]
MVVNIEDTVSVISEVGLGTGKGKKPEDFTFDPGRLRLRSVRGEGSRRSEDWGSEEWNAEDWEEDGLYERGRWLGPR